MTKSSLMLRKAVFNTGTVLIILFSLFSAAAVHAESLEAPSATAGVIDLRNFDFKTSGNIKLKGEWEFYWGKQLGPKLFTTADLPPGGEFRPVPANWHSFVVNGKNLPVYGTATYRLRVLTAGKTSDFGLRLKRIYSAYRLYVNGILIEQAGSLSYDLEETEAQLPIKTVFFESDNPEIEIILQVSNPYYQRAGILSPLELGSQDRIAKTQIFAIASDIFLLGVITIMAGYYFVIAVILRKHRFSSLYFAIFCVVVGLRIMLISGERFLYFLIPSLSLRTDMLIQGFGIYLLIPSFLAFMYYLFPEQARILYVKIVVYGSLFYLFCNTVLPSKMFGYVLTAYYPFFIFGLAYMLIIVIRAIIRKEPNAVLEGFGFLFILVSGTHDMLVDREIFHADYILPLGLLAFIFVQSVILSGRFSTAFIGLELLLLENKKNQEALETRVQERTSDLRKLNESLIIARNLAEEASTAKSRFLQNMSHEMRTPLNGILGYAELIHETDPKNIHQSYAMKIIDESRSLLDLINQLLDLSKIEAGKLNIENIAFDLEEFLRSVEDILNPLAERRRLEFRIFPRKDVPRYLLGDPVRLRQILVNLGGNAIKFTSEGWVEIRTELQEQHDDLIVVLFVIQDTGIGISREFQKSIFDRFTQAQSGPTRLYGGTGLGTTISKQLAELMHGTIGLSSEEGRGSTFWVSIPFKIASADAVSKSAPQIKDPHENFLAGRSILVVEDYPTTQQITRHHLESVGAKVIIAENGIEGIKSLGKHHFDCILMDIQMPQMDGIETTRLMRKLPISEGVPILGMTASAFKEDIQSCLDAGMTDVLTKPLRKLDLLKKLRDFLGPAGAARGSQEGGTATNIQSPFNFENLLRELAGHEDDAKIILEGFHSQLTEQLRRIETAIDEEDFKTAHREAHAVKGGALTIFAEKVSQAAANLEKEARSENVDIRDAFEELKARAQELQSSIEEILKER